MTETKTDLPGPKDLRASTALIVGGSAGIGLASARALAAAGVPRIVIAGRNAERGELAAKSIAEPGSAYATTVLPLLLPRGATGTSAMALPAASVCHSWKSSYLNSAISAIGAG